MFIHQAAAQPKPTEIISDDNGLRAEIEALRDIEKKHKNIISRSISVLLL